MLAGAPGTDLMLSKEKRPAGSTDMSERAASVEEDAALDMDSGMLYSSDGAWLSTAVSDPLSAGAAPSSL